MKANVQLEVTKEDLAYELRELIKELAGDEIRSMIRSQSKEMVQVEVNKILEPLVVSVLTNEKLNFSTGYYENKQTIETVVKNMTINYLNTPVYLYSKDGKTPSQRYMKSSSGQSDKSLINHIIADEIKLIVDSEFTPKVREILQGMLAEKEKLEAVFKDQVFKLASEKLK